jgi:quinoprotein glucose dehydrogenase
MLGLLSGDGDHLKRISTLAVSGMVAMGLMAPLAGPVLAVPIAAGTQAEKPVVVTPLPETTGKPAFDAATSAAEGFKPASGLRVEPFAVEPQLANPVAFNCDNQGRWFVVETFRFDDNGPYGGVYDIRHIYDRLDQDLACRTVEDRLAMTKRWLHNDLTRVTKDMDRVRRIEDTDGDGRADRSTVLATLSGPMSGLAAGVLPRGNGDVYVTDIPNLLLLHDAKNTGVSDARDILATGFGVHYSLLGHDLHGLTWGPDGRIYFSSGDRGQHVQTKEGKLIDLPDCGAVMRCEPDGSNLEVFAMGLRNPQGLTFDEYGNLFTGDNNADYGELARWEYIVQGGDHGWRIGYQHLKTPKPGGPWIAELLWQTPDKNTCESLIPPVGHVASGPSGNAFYPGTGLPERYADHFFQTDFVASSRSQVHSFALKPKGAGFEITDHTTLISGPLTSDVKFGIDGGIYVLDWAGNGYAKASRGRIWHVFDPETVKSSAVMEVAKLLKLGMNGRSLEDLNKLIGHVDQRVRQAAQFELARRGDEARPVLMTTLMSGEKQMARIHALWALGQISRAAKDNAMFEQIIPLLEDKDPEIRAQVARAMGDEHIAKAEPQLIKLLSDTSARVRFFAAMSIGKVGGTDAVKPVLAMLTAAEDRDPYLRHAGSVALAGIIKQDASLLDVPEAASGVGAKMGVLLAMRRMENPQVAKFLDASEPILVLEAARAINDTPITAAMPELAKLLTKPDAAKIPEFVALRALNANFRLGATENAAAIANYVANSASPETMRIEGMAMLGQWDTPRNIDRVVGVWRPFPARTPGLATDVTRAIFPTILLSGHPPAESVGVAAIEPARKIGPGDKDLYYNVVSTKGMPEGIAVAALNALADSNDPRTDAVVDACLGRGGKLREQAIHHLIRRDDAVQRLQTLLTTGSLSDQQAVFTTLGQLDGNAAAENIMTTWMNKLTSTPSEVRPEVVLDLVESAGKYHNPTIVSALKKYNDSRVSAKPDPIDPFRECLFGGDASLGRKIFFERADVSCIRCHKIGGTGGIAGPDLSGVAARKDRAYLLRSVVDPNAEIAPGFESIQIEMKEGHHYTGVVKADTADEVVLDAGDGAVVHADKKLIINRSKAPSGMPENIAQPLSKRDLRNLVEFLSQQKQPATQNPPTAPTAPTATAK